MRVIYLSLLALLIIGCGKPEAADSKSVSVFTCEMPKYKIMLGKMTPAKTNTMDKAEFNDIFTKTLANSKCFILESKMDKDTYTLDVTYNIALSRANEDVNMIKQESNIKLTSDISFVLKNAKESINQNATSYIKISNEKYIGLGKDAEISQAQKQELITRTLNTIFKNLAK